MIKLLTAIILAINTVPNGVKVPINEDPITWVFAECRAINALTSEFDIQNAHENEGWEKYNRWSGDFFALMGGFDIDTYELTNVGNTRAMAIATVTKDKILGNLNIENIDSHLLACGVSYEAMSLAVVEHS